MFIALKQHFTSQKYDYFKYNGKIRMSPDSVQYKRDKWNYVKLAKNYGDNLQDFIVSNMVTDKPATWSGNLISDDAHQTYIEWKKRKESFSYTFSEECDTLVDFLDQKDMTFDDLFASPGGQHPTFLKLYYQEYISLETLLAFAAIVKFMPKWDRECDDFLWKQTSIKMRKYRPFVVMDKPKLKKILQEKFT